MCFHSFDFHTLDKKVRRAFVCFHTLCFTRSGSNNFFLLSVSLGTVIRHKVNVNTTLVNSLQEQKDINEAAIISDCYKPAKIRIILYHGPPAKYVL